VFHDSSIDRVWNGPGSLWISPFLVKVMHLVNALPVYLWFRSIGVIPYCCDSIVEYLKIFPTEPIFSHLEHCIIVCKEIIIVLKLFKMNRREKYILVCIIGLDSWRGKRVITCFIM